jgi:hypothetical protein
MSTDYEIYHSTFTSALNEVYEFLRNRGLFLDEQDVFTYITTGPGKPKHGMTVRFYLLCYTYEGTPALRGVDFQIADLESRYELNMYINKVKSKDYHEDLIKIWE